MTLDPSGLKKGDPTKDLFYAFGGSCLTGEIKQSPKDFRVDEIPGFTPDGNGDHVYLTLEKKNLTTNDIVNRLVRFCGVKQRDIGFAGMKDKRAITSQVFSINLSGKDEPDWSLFESESISILDINRHIRKLKRGVLKGNRFNITINNIQGDTTDLVPILEKIKTQGVPNYFGAQRFGFDGSNLEKSWRLLNGDLKNVKRDEKSILLSSARSMIFNAVLNERVKNGSWNKLLDGEVINLDGTERHFKEPIDDVLLERNQRLDIHATGPLCGLASRALEPSDEANEIERKVLDRYTDWIVGLKKMKLDHARRALRIAVKDFQWVISENKLFLDFTLTSGAYATVVLRELISDSC